MVAWIRVKAAGGGGKQSYSRCILKTELSGFFWYIEYELVCLCVIECVREKRVGREEGRVLRTKP